VTVPGPGLLKIKKGSNSQGNSINAPAAGTYTLIAKTRGSAARKLRKKGKAKVKLSISFTPTGGSPASKKVTVTFKKKKKK
jgi:hypothetical protein